MNWDTCSWMECWLPAFSKGAFVKDPSLLIYDDKLMWKPANHPENINKTLIILEHFKIIIYFSINSLLKGIFFSRLSSLYWNYNHHPFSPFNQLYKTNLSGVDRQWTDNIDTLTDGTYVGCPFAATTNIFIFVWNLANCKSVWI